MDECKPLPLGGVRRDLAGYRVDIAPPLPPLAHGEMEVGLSLCSCCLVCELSKMSK